MVTELGSRGLELRNPAGGFAVCEERPSHNLSGNSGERIDSIRVLKDGKVGRCGDALGGLCWIDKEPEGGGVELATLMGGSTAYLNPQTNDFGCIVGGGKGEYVDRPLVGDLRGSWGDEEPIELW